MIFAHTWKWIATGEKTQTRRLIKPEQQYAGALPHFIPYVYTGISRKVYEIGKIYSVQPARTKPGIWWKAAQYADEKPCIHYAHTTWSDSALAAPYPATVWYLAQHTPIGHADGKPDPEKYLRNEGYQPLHIRITNIRKEDVRNISPADAIAEGFRPDNARVPVEAVCKFLETWTKMHDPAFVFWFEPRIVDWMWYTNRRGMRNGESCTGSWDSVLEAMKKRPANRYQSWALDFELAKE